MVKTARKPKTIDVFDDKKKIFVEIMKKKFGNTTESCKEMGITRQTVFYWKENCPEFVEALSHVKEHCLDFVEGKLFDSLEMGGVNAGTLIKFYLDRQGKGRGYADQKEIVHSTGNLDSLTEALEDAISENERDY